MTADDTTLVELRRPIAPAHGLHAIVQGTYGAVGNLELVVPDPNDGLWVYWRNNDPYDIRPGAVAGGWSAGLRFAQGARYDAASVLQTRHGPDNIEVLAITDSTVHRIFWSAGTGFSKAERIRTKPAVGASLFEDQAAPHDLILASTGDDGVLLLRGDSVGYPSIRFDARWDERPRLDPLHPTGPASAVQVGDRVWLSTISARTVSVFEAGTDSSTERILLDACANPVLLAPATAGGPLELVVGHAEGGLSLLRRTTDSRWREAARFGADLGRIDAIAACRSTQGGGQIEIVARVGETLQHGALPHSGAPRITFSPIETHAWVAESPTPLPQDAE